MKTKTTPQNNKWITYGEERPILGQLVAVFRAKPKKYTFARVIEGKYMDPEGIWVSGYLWETQYGCQKISADDSWSAFEFLEHTQVYK